MGANGLYEPFSADELWLIDRLRRVSEATPTGKRWGAESISQALPSKRQQSSIGCYLTTTNREARFPLEVRHVDGHDYVYRCGKMVGEPSQDAINILLAHFPDAARYIDLPYGESPYNEVEMEAADNVVDEAGVNESVALEKSTRDYVPIAPHQTEIDERGDTMTLSSYSWRIRTIDELLDFHQIDRAIWEADKPKIGCHEGFYKTPIPNPDRLPNEPVDYEERIVPMHRLSCSLRRKVSKVTEDAFAMLMERMRDEAPVYPRRSYRGLNSAPHLLEVALYDHHFGKLAWHIETGEDYDLRIADQLYRRAVDQIIARSEPYAIDRILLPIGHDLLNYDNARGETTAGTPQDNDSRPAKVFDAACAAVIYAVERLVEIAPVDVVYVPGNHDTNIGRFVACMIAAWFNHCAEVTVDTSPAPRKRYIYGDVFLGLTHGDGPQRYRKDLPMLFTQEFRQEWGKATHHEIHIGHFHTKAETSFMPLVESGGVLMRVLPSLCGRDYWHTRMGYLGSSRATDAFLWSATTGLAGYFTTNAEELLS